MNKSKAIVCVWALMFFVSNSAFALIIEGSFSGILGQFNNENMDATPDADFWHENENEFQPFTGTFSYDAEMGGPGISPWQTDLVMYIQERDWVSINLVGANGGSVDITSNGGLPSFSKHPRDSIYIERHDDGHTFSDRLSMFYGDFAPSTQYGVIAPHRNGSLTISSPTPILDGLGLVQNFEFSSELNGNKPIGAVHLGTKGTIGETDYEGEFWGEINRFEIHVREPVSVPEPSSLLLLLGSLVFLFRRGGLLPARF